MSQAVGLIQRQVQVAMQSRVRSHMSPCRLKLCDLVISTGLARGRGGAPQPAVEELVGALENVVMTTPCCLLHALGHARQLQLLCRVELLCLNTS